MFFFICTSKKVEDEVTNRHQLIEAFKVIVLVEFKYIYVTLCKEVNWCVRLVKTSNLRSILCVIKLNSLVAEALT